MRCQQCQSEQFTKEGHDRVGRQVYRCTACRRRRTEHSTSAFAGYRFPADVIALAATVGAPGLAYAQHCTRQGNDIICDDGRRGIMEGDAILWPDGTRSSASPHPSVIIGNKASVHIGPGVFVGKGKGMVPLDDPNAPNKTRCAIVDGVSYCY